MRNTRLAVLVPAAALLVSACAGPGKKSSTQLEWLPNMYVQPSEHAMGTDPLTGAIEVRTPPAGTVPIDYTPFPQPSDVVGMDHLVDPLPVTPAVLATGRKLFNTYCIVCHGARADGLGYIVPHMTQPPPLIAGAPLLFTDGRIFSIITSGQGNMPSYQNLLQTEQRWAIIHYVRVLQRAANPSPADMAAAAQQGMDFSDDYPPAQGRNGMIPGTEAIPQNPPPAGGGH